MGCRLHNVSGTCFDHLKIGRLGNPVREYQLIDEVVLEHNACERLELALTKIDFLEAVAA